MVSQTVVSTERRFAFGKNWQSFLSKVDDTRIQSAVDCLRRMLEVERLDGKTFLDVGSGSGLMSLSAMLLGASRVHSFDYDPNSVAATGELKQKYLPEVDNWTIERGSALDTGYLNSLGHWDIVYSWGVLHHTGQMWQALSNVIPLVADQGRLFISIYNDQGAKSRVWHAIKSLYNSNALGKALVLSTLVPCFALRAFAKDVFTGQNPIRSYRDYRKSRGMSRVHDWIDWLGGYPFEVAKPEEIFAFYRDRGFALEELTTCAGRIGCNQFVFRRDRLAAGSKLNNRWRESA